LADGITKIVGVIALGVGGEIDLVLIFPIDRLGHRLEIIDRIGYQRIAGRCHGSHPVANFGEIVMARIARPLSGRTAIEAVAADIAVVIDGGHDIGYVMRYLIDRCWMGSQRQAGILMARVGLA